MVVTAFSSNPNCGVSLSTNAVLHISKLYAVGHIIGVFKMQHIRAEVIEMVYQSVVSHRLIIVRLGFIYDTVYSYCQFKHNVSEIYCVAVHSVVSFVLALRFHYAISVPSYNCSVTGKRAVSIERNPLVVISVT